MNGSDIQRRIAAATGLNRLRVTDRYRSDFRRDLRNRSRRRSMGGAGG